MPVESVKWNKRIKREFPAWFHHQMSNALSDMQPLVQNWKSYFVQWRAKLPEGEKDFPWPGASNLEFPLTSMHADPIFADTVQSFHAHRHFWHVDPIHRGDRVPAANSLREALYVLDRDFLKMRQVNNKAFLYNTLLGTGIYKTHWIFEAKTKWTYDRNTNQRVKRTNLVSQPLVEHVPLNRFIIPPDSWEIDPDAPVGGAQWVAQKFYLRPEQLLAMADTPGAFEPAYDKEAAKFVVDWNVTKEDQLEAELQREDDYVPWNDKRIELFEVWIRYDADGDGVEEDIVFIWHQKTDRILRATYNPFWHSKRPFDKIRYLEGPGFYGIGVSELDDWAQTTMTKLLNAQIDNITLANTRMYAAPRGSNIEPGEAVYPGKIWMLGPGEAIGEVRLGDTYQSLPQVMGMVQNWAESRTAMPELRQGNISGLPSRTPAATTMSVLNEGKARQNEIIGSMRDPLGEIGLKVLQLCSQYYTQDQQKWAAYFTSTLGEADAANVLQVLDNPVDRIGSYYGILPTATSAAANKEVEKQSFIAVVQLISQIYPQLVQTALLVEQAPQGSLASASALAAYTAGVELLKRLLERFDIQNPESYVPNLQAVQEMQAQMQPPVPGGGQPGQGQGGGPEAQFAPLGGFFGPGPFQGAPKQMGELLGLGG